MSPFKKVGIGWFFFLIVSLSIFMTVMLFLIVLGVSIAFYFTHGHFYFSWKDALFTSLDKGVVVGSVLGCGLWIKTKLLEIKGKTKL